jgi:hypothetical protein
VLLAAALLNALLIFTAAVRLLQESSACCQLLQKHISTSCS